MIVSPVHFRELAAIEEMRERAEVIALLHRYGTTSCVISTPSDMSKRKMVQTSAPLRRHLRLQAALHLCASIRPDALDFRLQAVHGVTGGDV
jgi:hypothetical protein